MDGGQSLVISEAGRDQVLAKSVDIDDLFFAVQGLLPAQRQEKLSTLCVDNPELILQVEKLVQASQQSSDFLSRPLCLEADAQSAEIPPIIDVYAIRRRLGEGGMGLVYLAERIDGEFEQTVAIKIIKKTSLDPKVESLFIKERQILANLNHSGIVRLLGGGRTNRKQPYIVMEFIAGLPFNEYIYKKQCSLKQILLLFVEICKAVDYAHKEGVIHRDLKPANILINESGQVKLLDFGISNIFGDARNNKTANSNDNLLVTPEYVAPEILEGNTAMPTSDIYALGVILYEAVSGVKPYIFKSSSIGEIIQTICDAPVSAPSLVNRKNKINPSLDRIILKCLEKNPNKRFQSVHELIASLEGSFLSNRNTRSSTIFSAMKSNGFSHWLPITLVVAVSATLTWHFLKGHSQPTPTNIAKSELLELNQANKNFIHKSLNNDGIKFHQVNVVAKLTNSEATGSNISLNLEHIEDLFETRLSSHNETRENLTCVENNSNLAGTAYAEYKCNILKAQWFNQQNDAIHAMKSLLTIREYYQQSKNNLLPPIKAMTLQVFSETRSQLGEYKHAMFLQKKAAKLLRKAMRKDPTLRSHFVTSLKILSIRFTNMQKPRLAKKAIREARNYEENYH